MFRIMSKLSRLGWKWWSLITALTILFIVFVVAPAVIYYSRERNPPNYSDTSAKAAITYLVNYDSGDGVVNDNKQTLKVIETGVQKGSETCFHAVTVFDQYPKRKVNAVIVGSAKITLAGEEIWRSQNDLRAVSEEVMQMDLPIVNTAVTKVTYSGYQNYPGWPYHLNDSWTYEASYDTNVPLQPNWTDKFRADVVADNATVKIGNVEYRCFKVVHTLIDTTNGTPSGGGVGTAITEYWYRDGKSIGPIKIEDSYNYKGTETQIMIDAPPLLPL
ncbi:MAG: hypothetical protein WC749_06025 [Dehalococcoidia bacterium]